MGSGLIHDHMGAAWLSWLFPDRSSQLHQMATHLPVCVLYRPTPHSPPMKGLKNAPQKTNRRKREIGDTRKRLEK